MARPKGHELSREAYDDFLRILGLSTPAVSERANVPAATLRSLYGGHHKASVPQAHQIANALGVAPASLFPTLRQPRSVAEAVA